jgi:spore coat protein U-like protein
VPGPSKPLTLRTANGPLNDTRRESEVTWVKGLPAGEVELIAEFAGDDNYNAASGKTFVQVAKRTSTIAPTILPAPSSRFAGPVTFDLAIPAGVYGTATGSLTLTIDNRAPVTIALTNGRGQYTTNLAAGTYKANVAYAGDGNHTTASTQFDVPVYVAWGSPSLLNASFSGGDVNVTWTPVAGAASYTLFKKATYASPWQEIGVWTSSYIEAMPPSKTWMFAVAPRNEAGVLGPMSAPDIATSVAFADAPIVVRTTPIRGAHITELRVAVNALREFAGLAAYPFTETAISTIRAMHVTQLRAAIAQARSTVGLPAITFTDATLTAGTSKMRMVHIEEMRNGVR